MTEKPCKVWRGALNDKGYGVMSVKDPSRVKGYRQVFVHRNAWQEANGEIPPGMCVCHRCDNPPCYELEHLFLGTKADNNADMLAKGRHVPPRGEKCGNATLTTEKVLDMRCKFASGISRRELASMFGVGYRCVTDIINRRNWKHV